MYFSKHNERITYSNHYSGLLEVMGKGVLCREDAEVLGGIPEPAGQIIMMFSASPALAKGTSKPFRRSAALS